MRDLPSNLFQEWQGGRVNAHDPVGTYRAKAFGLHDTIGNVWEWCRDRHGSYVIDPMPGDGERAGDEGDTRRTVRGGSFINNAASAQAAVRYPTAPEQALRTSLAAASRPQQKLAAVCARLGICFLGVTPAIVARSPQRTRCD